MSCRQEKWISVKWPLLNNATQALFNSKSTNVVGGNFTFPNRNKNNEIGNTYTRANRKIKKTLKLHSVLHKSGMFCRHYIPRNINGDVDAILPGSVYYIPASHQITRDGRSRAKGVLKGGLFVYVHGRWKNTSTDNMTSLVWLFVSAHEAAGATSTSFAMVKFTPRW